MPSRMAELNGSLRPGARTDVSFGGQVYAWNSRH